MKNWWIIVGCLLAFAAGAYQLEKTPLFEQLRTGLRSSTIPSGVLDYGKMGKVLKELGLIRAVPNEDNLQLPGTFQAVSQSLLRISLAIDVDTELQVYWAGRKEEYSTDRLAQLPVTAGQKEYTLVIPVLNEIHRLRIDPSMQPAHITIKKITLEQYGREDIVLSPASGLSSLRPVNDIGSLHLDSSGLSFTATTVDPQLELLFSVLYRSTERIEKLAFRRKRQQTAFDHTASVGGMWSFPSSTIIRKERFKKNWPVVSIVMDDDDLYHPDTGIIPNREARGRQWERPVSFSYFDETGTLRFATMTGIRLHGGKRYVMHNSFRLYFRKEYGLSRFTEFQPTMLFSPKTAPLKRMVVHHTAWPEGGWFFNNTLAYDIARRIGCQVPETRLTLLYINGIEQGIFFLVPHLDESLLASYFGHNDFIFYKYKSTSVPLTLHVRLWQLSKGEGKMTMERVGREIDLDNFVRHLFSFVFCGTTDYQQGLAVLDTSRPDNKIFWINWDMDQSFIKDIYSTQVDLENWRQRAWNLVYSDPTTSTYRFARPRIFSRLFHDDPAFRDYVARLSMDLLNHRLTEAFFRERLHYYNMMLDNYGLPDTEYMKMLEIFLKNRPAFVREQMTLFFNLGPSFPCHVNGPTNIQYLIDGYEESAGYTGYYFQGKTISIRISSPHRQHLAYWLVNGKRIDGAELTLQVDAETTIEPVFQKNE